MGDTFSKPKAPPKPPPPPPPTPMPDPDAQDAARRRKQQEITMRSGRDSTILTNTGGNGKLGN